MRDMPHQPPTSAAHACHRLNGLSELLWDRQRYLATVRGKNNLELDLTPAELVSDIAIEADKLIAEVLLLLEMPAETPGVRRAMNRICYAKTA